MRFHHLILFVSLLLLPTAGLHAQETAKKAVKADSAFSRGDSIVAYAMTYLGKPYKYGCCKPDAGFDCSGFTYYVFSHFNINVPRASAAYANAGKEIPLAQARRGDIIVFTGTNANIRKPGHVGIITSRPGEPVTFVQASSSKNHHGVVNTEYTSSAYPKRFLKVIRVF